MIRFFLRLRRKRELDEEIRAHFEMAVADRVARGESPQDAEQAVREEFGDVARVKEATRELNVANLLLMRANGRVHEIAIRSTLGAGRGRILRLLLTESLLLSAIGGVLGLFVGFLGIRALLAVNTAGLPRVGSGGSFVGLDWRVVAFTLGLSFATSLLFGLAPALIGSRTDSNTAMKSVGSRSGAGIRQHRTRSILVTVEVGLAVVLLIGAGLLIRTSVAFAQVDLGFDPAHVLTMHTTLAGAKFQTALTQTVRAGLERIRSLPGVERAAETAYLPPGGALTEAFDIVGQPGDQPRGEAGINLNSERYFASLGIPVLRGRSFTARDDAAAAPVAIINEAMAKRYWASGRDPLQDSIIIGGGQAAGGGEPERRIVGVVGNAHYGGIAKAPQPMIYVPTAQLTKPESAVLQQVGAPTAWVVRMRSDTAATARAVEDALRDATGLPVVNVEPLERSVSDSVSRQRLNMLLMSTFGGAALLLAMIGIYGLLAYSVQQRMHEIGIRVALGADAGQVKRAVVRQGMLLVMTGIATGLVVAFSTVHVLASFLFGVGPHDPAIFVAVPVVLALVAFASVWLPAHRASRVNPLEALRYE